MRFCRARSTLVSALLCIVTLGATTFPVADSAAATSTLEARILNGTGVMRALDDGRFGTIDVATANSYKRLSYEATLADVQKVAAEADLIGFQEGQKWAAAKAYQALVAQGWGVLHDQVEGGRSELAVAWRTELFSYVRHTMRKMHEANPTDAGDDRSYPARYVLSVDLLHHASGQQITVINTHVNQHTERYADKPKRPGHPYRNINAADAKRHLRKVAELIRYSSYGARWTVVTGDLNWGYVADQREHHPDFVEGRIDPVAVSSFKSLGLRGTVNTHPRSGRYIDYVLLARNGPAGFRAHRVVGGLNSDHRAVVATVALS